MSVRKDKVQLSVEINGKQAGGSLRELETKAKALKRQLRDATDPKQAAEYTAQLRTVNSAISDIWRRTRQTNRQAGFLKKTLATLSVAGLVAGAIAGARAIFNLGKESLKLFDVQAKADAQLKTVIKSTNGAAKKSYEELKFEASEFQKQSLFGDEQIQKAQGTLLTFTKIQGDVFTQSTQSVLDYSAALGTDLQSASIQVGKALNDPIKGVSALGRAGVQFTDSQKAMIKSLQNTGDIAGAQAIVLKELETQFAGSAKAAAEAGLGPYTQLSNRLNDVKESVGLLIENGLRKLAPYFEIAVSFIEKFVDTIISGDKATGQFGSTINFIIGLFELMVGWYSALFSAGKFVVQSFTSIINSAKDLPLIGTIINAIISSFQFLFETITNSKAVFSGMQAAFKQSIDNVKASIEGAKSAFKIFAKEAELALTIRSSAREKLRQEISELKQLKEEASKSGTTVGEAYKNAYNQALTEGSVKTFSTQSSSVTTQNGGTPVDSSTGPRSRALITAPKSLSANNDLESLAYSPELKAIAIQSAEELAAERLSLIENGLGQELDALEKSFLLGIFTEEEYARKSLETKKANAEIELQVLEELGLSETELYRKKELEKLRVQEEIDQKQVDQAKRTAEIKKMLQQEGLNSFNQVTEATIDLLSKDEKARKKNAGLIKAFETAKILVNAKVEISEIFKRYAKIPFGTIIAAAQSIAVGLRSASAISAINSQSFYTGGKVLPDFTGQLINHPSNIPTQRGGDSVLATLKPGEVVLNQEQQARAGGSSFFRALGVPGFNTGGLVLTNANTTPSSSTIGSVGGGSTQSDSTLQNVSAAVSQLSAVLAKGIKSNVVYSDIQSTASELSTINELASY